MAANTPSNTADNTPQNTTENTPQDKLTTLMEMLQSSIDGGEISQVELLRINGGVRSPVAVVDGENFDPFNLKLPAGKYMARLKIDGKYKVSATISIDGPTSIAAAMPAPAPQGFDANSLLAMLMQQQQQGTQQMMQIFMSSQQQMTTLLTTVLANKSENKSPVAELIEGVERLQGLSGGAPESSGMGELAAVIGQVAPMLMSKDKEGVTLTPQQAAQVRKQLATAKKIIQQQRAPRLQATPAAAPQPAPVAAPKPAPIEDAAAEHESDINAAEDAGTEATEEQIAKDAVAIIKRCLSAKIKPATCAIEVFDLLDESQAGAAVANQFLQYDIEITAAGIAAKEATFRPQRANEYLRETLTLLREEIVATAEEREQEAEGYVDPMPLRLSTETDDVQADDETTDERRAA